MSGNQAEVYTPQQEVGILKRVAAATFAVGTLASGTIVIGTGVAVNEYFTKPTAIATNTTVANTKSQYEKYLTTLGPNCRLAVESTDGTVDRFDATSPICNIENVSVDIVNNYVNRYRGTIYWAETKKWWSGLAPIGASSLVTAAIAGALVLRRRRGHGLHDSFPVKIRSELLRRRRQSIEERDAEWRITNQQWLPLTSDAHLQEQPRD